MVLAQGFELPTSNPDLRTPNLQLPRAQTPTSDSKLPGAPISDFPNDSAPNLAEARRAFFRSTGPPASPRTFHRPVFRAISYGSDNECYVNQSSRKVRDWRPAGCSFEAARSPGVPRHLYAATGAVLPGCPSGCSVGFSGVRSCRRHGGSRVRSSGLVADVGEAHEVGGALAVRTESSGLRAGTSLVEFRGTVRRPSDGACGSPRLLCRVPRSLLGRSGFDGLERDGRLGLLEVRCVRRAASGCSPSLPERVLG
jgi:hypothetical protein